MATADPKHERPLATLTHKRSRQTRRDIISAAIRLCESRSFDDVTLEEIIAAAGVAKGTFYYHFRRKEDVLVDLAWTSVDRVGVEAEAAYTAAATLLDAVDAAMADLARRVNAMPPGAVARTLVESMVNKRQTESKTRQRTRYSFLSGVLEEGQRRGEIAADVDIAEVAVVLSYLIARTILDHVDAPGEPLANRLQRRVRLVLVGMTATYTEGSAETTESKPRRRKSTR
ncbi:MAG: TetR/AcrR family transcriptional regulator [Acidimicrobiia bacterium]